MRVLLDLVLTAYVLESVVLYGEVGAECGSAEVVAVETVADKLVVESKHSLRVISGDTHSVDQVISLDRLQQVQVSLDTTLEQACCLIDS